MTGASQSFVHISSCFTPVVECGLLFLKRY